MYWPAPEKIIHEHLEREVHAEMAAGLGTIHAGFTIEARVAEELPSVVETHGEVSFPLVTQAPTDAGQVRVRVFPVLRMFLGDGCVV